MTIRTCLIFVVALLSLSALTDAVVLKAEHHGEGGHPEHGQRGALYRFSLDNYDEQNRSLGEQTNLVVEAKLPAGTEIEEKYFYLEGHTDANKAFRDCTSKPDGDERIIVRCDIPRVLESVTMYIHSHFPKEKFSSSDLVDLERAGTKVIATLSKDGVQINDASMPLLQHWKDEL